MRSEKTSMKEKKKKKKTGGLCEQPKLSGAITPSERSQQSI